VNPVRIVLTIVIALLVAAGLWLGGTGGFSGVLGTAAWAGLAVVGLLAMGAVGLAIAGSVQQNSAS
jgi:hypothetical protein